MFRVLKALKKKTYHSPKSGFYRVVQHKSGNYGIVWAHRGNTSCV